jgi:hypothetical protein
MSSGAAHIQVVDGSFVVPPTRHRPQKKELFERKLTLKNIASSKAELALEVERSQNLTTDDQVLNIRSVFGNGVDDGVAEGFALIVRVYQRVRPKDR